MSYATTRYNKATPSAATPLDMSEAAAEVFVPTRHSSIQNARSVHHQVVNKLRHIDLGAFKAAAGGSPIGLAVGDVYGAGEDVQVEVRSQEEYAITARIHDMEGRLVQERGAGSDRAGWQAANLGPLPAGAYRVTADGGPETHSASDVFAVCGEF